MAGIPALAQAPAMNGGIQSPSDQFLIALEGPNLPQDAFEPQKDNIGYAVQNTSIVAQSNVPKLSRITERPPRIESNIALGESLAFGRVNWPCLYELGMRESGWNDLALNKTSGAFGIPQALPASKLDPNRYDPQTQINWMIGYVLGRYGGSCQALDWQIRNNWY